MGTLVKDLTALGPAPTLAREIPVMLINLVFTAVAVVALVVWQGQVTTSALVVGGVLVLYTVGRAVGAATRTNDSTSR